MTIYRIKKTSSTVAIALTQVGDNQERLLESFAECQEGRCSCPTDEYEKVTSMEVEDSADRIDIKLEARPGTEFDTAAIANCLDHTLAAADRA